MLTVIYTLNLPGFENPEGLSLAGKSKLDKFSVAAQAAHEKLNKNSDKIFCNSSPVSKIRHLRYKYLP